MEPLITRQYKPQFQSPMSATTQSPRESSGDKGLRLRWHHVAGCRGGNYVQMGSLESRKKSPFDPSRRRGSPSTRIGTLIHFAPIAWRVRLLATGEHLAAGHGGSAATIACRPHSEHHQCPIGNGLTRRVQDFVVSSGNRFIASAGMPTYGTPGQTKTRPGTAPVWSHGNSGPRQVTTLAS